MQIVLESPQVAELTIANRLIDSLKQGDTVVWFVSGGSNICAQVRIMDQLRDEASEHLSRLTILPSDERYGEAGHPDSNYQQLVEAGFQPSDANWPNVLGQNLSHEQTAEYYWSLAEAALSKATDTVAQFGIGADAHIAGIILHSPAAQDDVVKVVAFEHTDFKRLTLTRSVLSKLKTAYVLAYGDGKREALSRLVAHDEPFSDVPSNLLYDIADSWVYTDQEV